VHSPRSPALSTRRLGASLLLAALVLVGAVCIALIVGRPLPMDLVMSVRAPRIALAGLAGAGLAAVGVAVQALLRNPLADPYVLGVSGGAALGATVAIALGAGALGAWSGPIVPGCALAGGLGATVLVYMIATAGGERSATSLLLAGVIVNSIASALITSIKTLVSASTARELLFWLIGFVDAPTPLELTTVAGCVVFGSAVLLADAGRMNLLTLGDQQAQHLGVNVRALSLRTYAICSFVVAAIVSLTGIIGFVGLVVPHAVRRLAGPDHRVLLPMCLLTGAAMLIVCDTLVRATLDLLPVGVITALIGGPVFLLLLRRKPAY
jgi:iron complex transport system permease protein